MSLNSETLRFLKKWLLPIVLGIGMMRALVKEGFAQSGPMISVVAVQKMQAEGQPVSLIEISKYAEYESGHLPGAVHVWRSDYQDNSYPFEGVKATKQDMSGLLQRLGVDPVRQLVLYDERGNVNAARFRWILKSYGYPGQVYLLEGGKAAWKRQGHAYSLEIPEPVPSTFSFLPDVENPAADPTGLAMAKLAQGNPDFKLVDCRHEGEFLGQTLKNGAGRAGRIPGAMHFDYMDFLRYEGEEYQGLIPEPEMRRMLDSVGLRPEDRIVVYCHSGVRSAHLSMVLTEILGYQNVTNYDGSWVEWSHDPTLPTESGPPAILASAPPEVVASEAVASSAPSGIDKYGKIVKESYVGFWNYLVAEVTFDYDYKPIWQNYFWGLILISLFFFGLEMFKPWRPDQARFRKDFWLDAFYMFFNFFIFGLIIFAAVQNVFTELFNDFLGLFGVENIVAVQIDQLPAWAYFGILFFIADFLQWWIHRLLHRVEWLWQFHKVHHSVEEMGFAAHLRYHWMENVVYKGIQAIPLTMLGYNLVDLGVLHLFNLAWGHFNHSNIHVSPKLSGSIFGGLLAFGVSSLYPEALANVSGSVSPLLVQLGIVAGGMVFGFFVLRYVMRYLFNSPEMHLWHHAHDLPEERRFGVNFGLTLAIWDWIFGTVYWPHDRGDVKLGFPGLAKFPKSFLGQLFYPLSRNRDEQSEANAQDSTVKK